MRVRWIEHALLNPPPNFPPKTLSSRGPLLRGEIDLVGSENLFGSAHEPFPEKALGF
jgi:hypothetical protein